jgi:hypothetical protein
MREEILRDLLDEMREAMLPLALIVNVSAAYAFSRLRWKGRDKDVEAAYRRIPSLRLTQYISGIIVA